MARDHQLDGPSGEEQAVIGQARQRLAEQAGISTEEASSRILLYARFQDLRLNEAARQILSGTARLLTVQELNRQLEDDRAEPGPPER